MEIDKLDSEEIQSILKSYIKNDYKDYISKGLKYCDGDKNSLQPWFMTQKFLKNKKFKSEFNKLK